MNKQGVVNSLGLVEGGIEWTKTKLCDGTERQGYTWNPIAGCQHRCRWIMPNGEVAICYAEETAKGIAKSAYPNGFEHHYYKPHKLDEPSSVKTSSKIFIDSMSDLFGAWVTPEETQAVLKACADAYWHIFQVLTKAPPRIKQHANLIPSNVWVGVSSPPDFFKRQRLSRHQQERMLHISLEVLSELQVPIKWLSIEPLSWDISPILTQYPDAIQWAVLGAASMGDQYFQPYPDHIQSVLEVLDAHKVKVFFKGNLRPSMGIAFDIWREFFPPHTIVEYQKLGASKNV